MLIGQYTSKLTEGNRLAIPKKFREELGSEIIIAKWYEGSLVLVSRDNWYKLMSRLIGDRGLITSPVRDIDRFVMGSAFEIDLDAQGRFVLPDNLTGYILADGELVFVGLGDRVEIWPRTIWQKLESEAESKASAAIETIAKSGK